MANDGGLPPDRQVHLDDGFHCSKHTLRVLVSYKKRTSGFQVQICFFAVAVTEEPVCRFACMFRDKHTFTQVLQGFHNTLAVKHGHIKKH